VKKAIEFISKNLTYQAIQKELHLKTNKIHIQNTTEESSLLFVISKFLQESSSIFVVAPNLYRAQIIYDKLYQTLGNKQVDFFPQDEFITSEMLVSSVEFKVERINTIKDILTKNKRIIVTHLPGLLKPQMRLEDWKTAIFRLVTKEQHSISRLSETLIEYGYIKEYTVEKPGDFSVRGGIVDIFPFGEKQPFRIDFFGDQIEKIKVFDIESQRSISVVNEITIIPMVEFFYGESGFLKLQNIISSKLESVSFSDEAKSKIFSDLESLREHRELDRLTRYIPFLTDTHETILDFVQDKSVFFFDYNRIKEQYSTMIDDVTDWYMTTDDYVKMDFSMLYNFDCIHYDQGVFFDFLEYKYSENFDKAFILHDRDSFKYDGNLTLLFQDLKGYINKKTTIISFQTLKARQNFQDLLDENNIHFQLIGKEDYLFSNEINLLVSDEYFDLYSDTFELVIITEQTIQKRQTSKKKGSYISVYENSKRLSSISDLKLGDYIVHYDYGIGKFLEIKTMELGNTKNDYIHIEYRDGDKLYIPIESFQQIQKYAGSEGFVPRLSKLGGTDWAKTKQRVRSKAKDIADKLIKLYALREQAKGFAFLPNDNLEDDFENDFPFEETKDQTTAIEEVLNDMSSIKPMDRLLCGDVGFGKTEVALRAAFRAVLNNKQVAYLAPTTVLSKQHFHTFVDRMEKYGVNVELLNRFITKKHQKDILNRLKLGSVDVLIGTHRILSKDILFKDLGLLIIDEEQRFGVEHKEIVKEMKVNVDVLSLSATPIPRTLQMAIMGVKNMSLLETAPENRYPIQTYVLERNDTIIKDAIERELSRKGQVFYIYNRIEDIERVAARVQKLVPEARIQIAHGQMHKLNLERVIDDFISQEIDVLISTTIIETGIDIPNANTLIIHDADRLGLSQLYQIRGRVGRSNRIAYAYLMYQKSKVLTEEAEKRLKVIKEFTELGSGFKIAIRDLSIRGAGDVLGSEQSGFIDSVGIDLYMKILEEEIQIKQGLPEDKITVQGVKAKVSKFIDEEYIEDDFIKIEMHRKINNIKSSKDIKELLNEFSDRFGKYDNELEIYMYEKLFEHLTSAIKIEKIIDGKTNVTLIVSEEGTKLLAGDRLFSSGMEVSKFIRFAYKKDRIHIILDKISLEKHWLYTMVNFLEKIMTFYNE